MKTTVVYESATGNTAAVARAILAALPEEAQGTLCGPDEAAAGEAQLIFAGFWTDKGSCSPAMAQFLAGLHGKRVALFGTAGFGGSQEYFDGLLERGELRIIREYLREHIHQYGKLKTSRQLLMDMTGEDFNPDYYVRYLLEKYRGIYRVR